MNNGLDEVRKKIDILDGKIAGLLLERLSLVLPLAVTKGAIEDRERESEIIKNICERCGNEYEKEFVGAVYSAIFGSGKKLMKDKRAGII